MTKETYMKTQKKGYGLFLIISIILTLAAISTLLPQASVSKQCLLGYKAHCSLAPISTVICLLLAGLLCKTRKKKFTETK